jgi:hypothetical protein
MHESIAARAAQLVYHTVILDQAPLSEFRELVEAYPESLQTPVHHALVIHHVCIFVQSLEIIQYLVEAFPASLMIPWDTSGKLPIHCALGHPGTSQEMVEYLAEMCPESLSKPDYTGRLPIHMACLNGYSLSILKLLADKSPGSIEYPDLNESLPIHLALTGGFGGMLTRFKLPLWK